SLYRNPSAEQRLFSLSWCQLSDQAPGRNGSTTSCWKTTLSSASAASTVKQKSPFTSAANNRSSNSSMSGPSVPGADRGEGRGSAAQTAIGVAVSCTRRTAPGPVELVAGTITDRVTVTALAQASIGRGG